MTISIDSVIKLVNEKMFGGYSQYFNMSISHYGGSQWASSVWIG